MSDLVGVWIGTDRERWTSNAVLDPQLATPPQATRSSYLARKFAVKSDRLIGGLLKGTALLYFLGKALALGCPDDRNGD